MKKTQANYRTGKGAGNTAQNFENPKLINQANMCACVGMFSSETHL